MAGLQLHRADGPADNPLRAPRVFDDLLVRAPVVLALRCARAPRDDLPGDLAGAPDQPIETCVEGIRLDLSPQLPTAFGSDCLGLQFLVRRHQAEVYVAG